MLDVLIQTSDASRVTPEFREMIKNSGIPINRILVSTLQPLGLGRESLIQQAETEKFVWLDDDVWLPKKWYEDVMKYWTDGVGWLESYALPSAPKWYADWEDYIAKKKGLQDLKHGEQSYNCCAVVLTQPLKDWRYPKGNYIGFASEDLLMSNHMTEKGYKRLRVPLVADHRINYTDSIALWQHLRKSTKTFGSFPEHKGFLKAAKYAASCFRSGCGAAVSKRNASIVPNAAKWSSYWFRDLI